MTQVNEVKSFDYESYLKAKLIEPNDVEEEMNDEASMKIVTKNHLRSYLRRVVDSKL